MKPMQLQKYNAVAVIKEEDQVLVWHSFTIDGLQMLTLTIDPYSTTAVLDTFKNAVYNIDTVLAQYSRYVEVKYG